MNAKKAKQLRKIFPDWNVKEFTPIRKKKLVRDPRHWIRGFIEVTRVTLHLKPGTDASSYRRAKRTFK